MRLMTLAMVLILIAASATAQYGGCFDDWRDDNCPIVINFAGNYELTGSESPVRFDILGTGDPILIGWTAAGGDEAFLCQDRDHNGKIDDGSELFGNAVMLDEATRARNGFIALTTVDANFDAMIDALDPIWSELRLWRDVNHDGISQPSEITPVAGSGLTAIGLEHHWTGRRDSSGNAFRYESKAWIKDKGKDATPRPVYDIFFVGVQ
jgi:hypothetical protein